MPISHFGLHVLLLDRGAGTKIRAEVDRPRRGLLQNRCGGFLERIVGLALDRFTVNSHAIHWRSTGVCPGIK